MSKTQTTRKWTRETYDALYSWVSGPIGKKCCIDILTKHDMADVVAELHAADNLGVWYMLTREAAEALPMSVVAASAQQAEAELDAIVAAAD